MRPVLVGEEADPHVTAVVEGCKRLGCDPLVFDVTRFAGNSSYSLSSDRLQLDDTTMCLDDPPGRGWIRRLAPPGWRQSVPLDTHDGVVRSALLTLLTGVVRTIGVEWLSPLDPLLAADNKVVQWRACLDLNIPVPTTAITSDKAEVQERFGATIVVKPLGPGMFRDDEGGHRVVFANEMRVDDGALDLLAGAPFLVQEVVSARQHLRIVTVGDRSWAYESSETRALDWRELAAAHSSFRLTQEWPMLESLALKLTARLGVGFSSQDWIVGLDGRPRFLDLNPGGQWMFLSGKGSHATDAIAHWLARLET